MKFVDAPFVAEDAQILATEAEVKAYLTAMLHGSIRRQPRCRTKCSPSSTTTEPRRHAPKQRSSCATPSSRKADLLVATGRDGLSRGVLLVKANGGKPVVVGVGY